MNAFKVAKLSVSTALAMLALLAAGCYYVPAYDTYYDDPGDHYYRPYRSYSYYGYYGYPYYYDYPRYYGPSTSLSIDIIGGGHGHRDRRGWGGVPYRHHDGDRHRGRDRRHGGDHRH